jgi:hypothetical protein
MPEPLKLPRARRLGVTKTYAHRPNLLIRRSESISRSGVLTIYDSARHEPAPRRFGPACSEAGRLDGSDLIAATQANLWNDDEPATVEGLESSDRGRTHGERTPQPRQR